MNTTNAEPPTTYTINGVNTTADEAFRRIMEKWNYEKARADGATLAMSVLQDENNKLRAIIEAHTWEYIS